MWCEACQKEHGELYICPHYSEEKKKELREQADRIRADMCRPGYVQEQLDKGMPIEVIAIMAWFMGLELTTEPKPK